MAKPKRKRLNIPCHKRMNRSSRLQAAKHWIPRYDGSNLIHGYSKHFAVDKLCAVKEFELLGLPISENYKSKKQRDAKRRGIAEKKKQELMGGNWEDSDETFAFIAGYTDGGTPYGITWEEWKQSREKEENRYKEIMEESQKASHQFHDDGDLPF
ncbi:hypothetical protein [Oceanobacillus sp. Castelsardo]|uniref:hypothetical protein n=1 Tax=Oceanobacillus sp. Castelsardo TaxID=1851204 RepID=UPI000838BC23|nr:hypothetical protein [Oceanobacillus sp. Castelsardo]